MSDKLTTASTLTPNPITLTEAKTHCNVTSTADDTQLTNLINAAGRYIEERCGRAFLRQTRTLTMDGFDDSRYVIDEMIRPPVSPLLAVSSVKYVDTNGTTQTMASSDYRVDKGSQPGRISLDYGASWPATRGVADDVTITYAAGYGSTTSSTYTSIPAHVRQAVRLLVGHWYINREVEITGHITSQISHSLDMLLEQETGATYG